MNVVHVVVPAYQPSEQLPRLIEGLLRACPSAEVLVIDDGSGPDYRQVFAAAEDAGARVHRLARNHGKGHALRVGFRLLHDVRANGPVVTADADGQHAVRDIIAVADGVDEGAEAHPYLVLGERRFDSSVPYRSRAGNTVTRWMFRAATGRRLIDTQTGLRAFPSTLLPWLTTLRGDRYEYELVMLLQAARSRLAIRSVPIETIYLDDNSSSHFRPLADSVRIYAPLLAFIASSLTAFVIDTLALLVLHALFGVLLPAVVGARVLSATVNFAMNRRFVFGGTTRERGLPKAVVRYGMLAAGLLVANYLVLSTLYAGGVPLLPAKLFTELVLVATSYVLQARFVFARPRFVPVVTDPVGPALRDDEHR